MIFMLKFLIRDIVKTKLIHSTAGGGGGGGGDLKIVTGPRIRRVLVRDSLPISISIDVGRKLHLHFSSDRVIKCHFFGTCAKTYQCRGP